MKQYYISFYGSSGDGYVGYDNRPCISLDMAMKFSSQDEAFLALDKLQREWSSNLEVCEVPYDSYLDFLEQHLD